MNIYIRKADGSEARFPDAVKIEASATRVTVQSGTKSKPVNFRRDSVREVVLHGLSNPVVQ